MSLNSKTTGVQVPTASDATLGTPPSTPPNKRRRIGSGLALQGSGMHRFSRSTGGKGATGVSGQKTGGLGFSGMKSWGQAR